MSGMVKMVDVLTCRSLRRVNVGGMSHNIETKYELSLLPKMGEFSATMMLTDIYRQTNATSIMVYNNNPSRPVDHRFATTITTPHYALSNFRLQERNLILVWHEGILIEKYPIKFGYYQDARYQDPMEEFFFQQKLTTEYYVDEIRSIDEEWQ